MFVLAEMSNLDVEDVRAMYLEKKFNPKNVTDLWWLIPDATPIDPRNILRPVQQHEKACAERLHTGMVYKLVNAQELKELPKWEWDQIFSLFA